MRTYTLTKSIFQFIDQSWQNLQHMDKAERKRLIKQVVNMKKNKTAFISYYAKFQLAQMLHHSECYFNGKGYTAKVKEFEAEGWYNQEGQLCPSRVFFN